MFWAFFCSWVYFLLRLCEKGPPSMGEDAGEDLSLTNSARSLLVKMYFSLCVCVNSVPVGNFWKINTVSRKTYLVLCF